MTSIMTNLLSSVFIALLILLNVPCYSLATVKPIPPNLIEVNAKNKPKCVEFFTVNGKSFCSTKSVFNDGGVSQSNYDQLNVQFDQRVWTPAWGKNGPGLVSVEYVVKGDNIKAWKELVTSQFIPKSSQRFNASLYAENFILQLKNKVPAVKTQYLMNEPNEVIFEFKLDQPVEMAQHEIQRVFCNNKSMYIVHYATKKPDMGQKAVTQWVNILKKATPKN